MASGTTTNTCRRVLRSVKRIQSEYFLSSEENSTKKVIKKGKVKHEPIKPEYEETEKFKLSTGNESSQIEKWEPPHWKQVYEAVSQMRSKRDAAVDQLGAEKCSDEDSSPEVRRFHTLIGLMLSSQTKDAVTHAAVMRLREHGLTVENILNTPLETLKSLIYPVGFYKRKAEYIMRSCQILKEKYKCDIPPTVEELCALPGVGQKMAYLCMDIAWDKLEGIGVDTHVHRISNRLGWTRRNTKTPEGTRKELEDWLPKDYWSEVNLLLVGFGQQICLPVNPKCSDCLAQQFCPYGKKTKNSLSRGKKIR